MNKKIITFSIIFAFAFTGVVFAAEINPISCVAEVGDCSDVNLNPSEVNTDVTCEDIGLTSTLKRGSRGGEVIILQEILTNAGFYSGVVDGRFGSGTKSAVKMLQEAVSIKPDGVVGPMTRESMREFCVDFAANS